jgi:hypothetical protein
MDAVRSSKSRYGILLIIAGLGLTASSVLWIALRVLAFEPSGKIVGCQMFKDHGPNLRLELEDGRILTCRAVLVKSSVRWIARTWRSVRATKNDEVRCIRGSADAQRSPGE